MMSELFEMQKKCTYRFKVTNCDLEQQTIAKHQRKTLNTVERNWLENLKSQNAISSLYMEETKLIQQPVRLIRHQVCDELQVPDNKQDRNSFELVQQAVALICYTACSKLSWSHSRLETNV